MNTDKESELDVAKNETGIYFSDVYAIVIALGIVLTIVFGVQHKSFIKESFSNVFKDKGDISDIKGDFNSENEAMEESTLKPFSLLRYMPYSTNFSMITDPGDEDLFWFHGFAFVGSFNRATDEVKDYTFFLQGSGASVSDIARQGDFLLVGHQGYDLEVLNLQSGEHLRFTEKDGLASVSNIRFYIDQSNKNLVWVQNFEGLSVLDLSSMKLTLVRKPAEVLGSKWEPHIIYVDDEYVWANVNTNSYVKGAVVRIDKNNFNIDPLVWSDESFVAGEPPQTRIDVGSSAGNDSGIAIEEDKVLYVFNSASSAWDPIRVFKRSDPSPKLLDINGDDVIYRVTDKVYKLNVSTQTETLIQDLGTYNTKVKNNIDFRKDPWRDRYMMYEWRKIGTSLGVFDDVSTDPVWSVLQPIKDTYMHADTQLMDVFQDEMLLYDGTHLKALNVHSWNKKNVLNNTKIKLSHILPTQYLVFEEDFCDGLGCPSMGDDVYRSTTTLLNREDLAVISETPLNSDSFEYTFEQGDARGDIGFRDSQQAATSLLVFDTSTGHYATGSVTHYFEPYDHRWGANKRVRIKHPDVPFQVEYINAGIGDYLTITHHLGTSEEATMTVPFVDAVERPFANNQAHFKVSDVEVYDGALWFATNRGLIRMDIETFEAKVFTTKDGLFSNSINRVYFGDVMVVEHSTDVSGLVTGIFVYEINF